MKRTKKIMLVASLVIALTCAVSTAFAGRGFYGHRTSSIEITNTSEGVIENTFIGTANTGDNHADYNGLDGKVTSGGATAGLTASNRLNSTEIDATLTSSRRTSDLEVENSNFGSVLNASDFLANAGGNTASYNGGLAEQKSIGLTVNATASNTETSSQSTYSAENEECCTTPVQFGHCRTSTEKCCTESEVDKAESSASSTAERALDVDFTYERTATPMGSGTVEAGTADVTTDVTTVLNSSVIKITR